jgi:hypothetical protein
VLSKMKYQLKWGFKSLSLGLCLLMGFPPAPAQTMPTALMIVVVEGEGATNNVRERVTRDPVVRVEDENHNPVSGAVVVFTLPTEGATGDFGNGGKTMTVQTDIQGKATANGLRLNQIAGKVPIHINASYRGLAARTIITLFAVLPPGAKPAPVRSSSSRGHGALIGVLLAVGGAAAGGGAYFATRNKTSSTPTTPVTPPGPTAPTPIGITVGAGAIAGGH